MSDIAGTPETSHIVSPDFPPAPEEDNNTQKQTISTSEQNLQTGRVIRAQSGFFTVQTANGPVTCQIGGKMKIVNQRAVSREETRRSDLVALNDTVTLEVNPTDPSIGTIISVDERTRVLSRVAPKSGVGTSAEAEQIIIANCDQAVFVFAARKPKPNPRYLDRLLVIAEKAEIPSIVICVNKTDLLKSTDETDIFATYRDYGYRVIYTSAVTGEGLDELQRVLSEDNRVSVFTGPSGVGKSSLLNALQEGLRLQTQDVSKAHHKGRHTTRFSQLLEMDSGGYVADTPGIRAIAPWDIEPHELDHYFKEIRPLIADCKFADCSHRHEPGCAVINAVEGDTISPERYDSYLRMRDELEEQYIY